MQPGKQALHLATGNHGNMVAKTIQDEPKRKQQIVTEECATKDNSTVSKLLVAGKIRATIYVLQMNRQADRHKDRQA